MCYANSSYNYGYVSAPNKPDGYVLYKMKVDRSGPANFSLEYDLRHHTYDDELVILKCRPDEPNVVDHVDGEFRFHLLKLANLEAGEYLVYVKLTEHNSNEKKLDNFAITVYGAANFEFGEDIGGSHEKLKIWKEGPEPCSGQNCYHQPYGDIHSDNPKFVTIFKDVPQEGTGAPIEPEISEDDDS